jgi:hypothetical protein
VLLKAVVNPTHTFNVPVILATAAFTVTVANTLHPEPTLYVMRVVPAAMPVTSPVVELIVALAGELLAHVPPAVASVSVTVAPAHTVNVPAIAAGAALTLTTAERPHVEA